jgi:transposase
MEQSDMKAQRSKRFSTELRESVARRYLSTDATLRELAEEIGGSTWSVRDWVRQYRERGTVGKRNKAKATPTDKRSPEEKLRLLLQAKALDNAARGDFLRQEGIHDGDLERWEAEALAGSEGATRVKRRRAEFESSSVSATSRAGG